MLRAVEIAGAAVPAGSHVWLLGVSGDEWEVEHGTRRGRVPRPAILECPVARPSLERLRALDACFGRDRDAFAEEHVDRQRYFTILRCKAHGALFLDDTRGTLAWYGRITLLDPADGDDWQAIWVRYHALSDDLLNHLGRTL